MTRRVLVTGATSGLGSAIIAELRARGCSVRATGRRLVAAQMMAATGAEYVAADLTAADADLAGLTKGMNSVIHAAALSASWGDAALFEATNVTATRRLIDAAQSAGVSRFVFISSPSIFADFRDREGIGANASPRDPPLNHYARTKLAAERMVLDAARGLFATCAIRPRALVGPGDQVILPRLADLASRRRLPLPRGGRARIELTDLRDAATAICNAEDRAAAVSGMAFNISGGQPVSVAALASRLAQTLNRQPQILSLPVMIAGPLATMLEATATLRPGAAEPVLTRYTFATMAYSQTFDLEPARHHLGYQPRYDALETLLTQARQLLCKDSAA